MSAAPDAKPSDPAAASRSYVFIGLMALLVVAAAMFARSYGSLIAALLPAAVAATGLLLRWTAMPVVALLLLAYFIVLPFGWMLGGSFPSDVHGSAFRLLDLVLVAACLVYFASQYRLFSLTTRAMPSDDPAAPKGETPRLRANALVAPDEYQRLSATLVGCLFAGQFLWIVIATVRVDFALFPPFELASDVFSTRTFSPGRGGRDRPEHRFLMLLGVFGLASLVVGLVFWYWRLTRLSRAEGAMTLLDTGWRENRRELNRQEKWRAWGVKRARRAAGLLDEPPKSRGLSWAGCFHLALFAVLGPIALFLLIRLAWPIFFR